MFVFRYATDRYRPDLTVTLRSGVDGWTHDVPGEYEQGAWTFHLDAARYGPELECKLVLERYTWSLGANLRVAVADNATVTVTDAQVQFPETFGAVVENGVVQRTFFQPDLDEGHLYDVVVVGSGLGGGLLADQLCDSGADVLVVEAGPYLFPTHVANLPRQLVVGRFDKHVWGLYDEFSTRTYANEPGSAYAGRQAFNLGGKTLFWGGLIPRLGRWELDGWPAPVRDYLLGLGYRLAEDALNRVAPSGSAYQDHVKGVLAAALPEYVHLDAPMAVAYAGTTPWTIPSGMFSTADLLLEDRLILDPGRPGRLTVNLNHPAQYVTTDGRTATGVVCADLVNDQQRTFRGRRVVLAAGTLESAKIALQSGLADASGLMGKGLTDHPILFAHFALPPGSAHAATQSSAKVWSRWADERGIRQHPYNVVVEVGADFNQGRFADRDSLDRHRAAKGDVTFGEIVFLLDTPLLDDTYVASDGPAAPVRVNARPVPVPGELRAELDAVASEVLGALGAEPIAGGDLGLRTADIGAVAHEVGTLRMGPPGAGVVDEELRFHGYDNLYACDLSVFPTSPAANPSLTLAALALRLATDLLA